jgi:hypothetical protein
MTCRFLNIFSINNVAFQGSFSTTGNGLDWLFVLVSFCFILFLFSVFLLVFACYRLFVVGKQSSKGIEFGRWYGSSKEEICVINADSCEHRNKPLCSIKDREFLDYMSDYQLFKDSAPCNNNSFRVETSTVKTEATCFSKMLVITYKTTQHHILEDHNQHMNKLQAQTSKRYCISGNNIQCSVQFSSTNWFVISKLAFQIWTNSRKVTSYGMNDYSYFQQGQGCNNVQVGTKDNPVCPMGTTGSFHGGKAARVWSWPATST